ncbi:uncharacterized protein LOC121367600 [Gigantopelta aegis]|uniref:uncharacterized protein LOC121367600 n=1 Tax=Gigantopelta aegis TaxID=1735272 RepID=UPI001B887558|nr:uncharacterized protein LOC121367600 [Gigantopelta aegis]XP_041347820.1 uncharacterized protein LOC121367600 [Gigantopelta aegis]XP_041347829.1 uncharacterized protein LOC121367600 [Gigantopelta aegis]
MTLTSWYVLCLTLITQHILSVMAGLPWDLLALDWLCNEDSTHARDIPWDCSSYLVCHSGKAYPFKCRAGTLFDNATHNCVWPNSRNSGRCKQNPLTYIDTICRWNPNAKLPSPVSCGQYFDCSQTGGSGQYAKYVMECPYPQLFSERNKRCEHFKRVQCGTRRVPKAPCDYVQYLQLCQTTKCRPCERRHPSCKGRNNGFQPIYNAPRFYMFCDSERTLDIKQCPPRQTFSSRLRRCISVR